MPAGEKSSAPSAPASATAAPPAAAVASAGAVKPASLDATPPDPELVARLKADVAAVAVERHPRSPGWLKVQRLIQKRLEEAGLAVATEAFAGGGRNVIATAKGTTKPEELVILSAHYDHIPGCAGADDNASGVAVLLEAARVLGTARGGRTLVLAFWDHEEAGLFGSRDYAARAESNGTEIAVMISLDGVGFADRRPKSQTLPDGIDVVLPEMVRELEANEHRGDFLAVIGDEGSSAAIAAFDELGHKRGLNVMGAGLSKLSRLALLDAARSDHASFWLAGYPGILITDTANFRNPNYHCGAGPDVPESLDYDFLARVALTTIDVVRAARAE
jgi:Zn-dependent M28 family amino/carboxypeptidase